MNKRGSHIGVIISFIIFIGMIVFLYSILAPKIQVGQSKQSTINSLALNLESMLSGNLTTVSVYANSSSSCVNLSDFASNANLGSPLHATAQNPNGETESSGVSGSGFYIEKTNSANKFFTVYDSANLNKSQSGSPAECTTLGYGSGDGNYTIGQIKTNKYVFESLVKNMINNYGDRGYGSNYPTLQKDFGLPIQENFGFNFIYQNGTPIQTGGGTPASISVYSQSFPVSYVTVNGSVETGELVVKLW